MEQPTVGRLPVEEPGEYVGQEPSPDQAATAAEVDRQVTATAAGEARNRDQAATETTQSRLASVAIRQAGS